MGWYFGRKFGRRLTKIFVDNCHLCQQIGLWADILEENLEED